MDEIRRTILKTGAAAATMAAAPQVFAQETGQGTAKFYEKGSVRIAYQDVGSGFPLLLIAGGGLNSKMAGLATSPFNPIEEFKGEYRCIAASLHRCIAASLRTCATPMAASPPARSKSTGRGTPTPMIISV
jgi:hypothetical protein